MGLLQSCILDENIYYPFPTFIEMDITNLVKSGKRYLDQGDYNNALSFFDQALSIEPTNPDLWNLKGIALRSLGRYDEASDCYNKSLEIEPRDTESS